MNRIILKKTSTKSKRPDPSELLLGELAINTEDGLLFFKNKNEELHVIGSSKINTIQEIIHTSVLIIWLVISCILLAAILKHLYFQ